MNAYRICLIFVILWITAGCKTSAETKTTEPRQTETLSAAAGIMELYDSSFRSLFYRHVSRQGPDFEQLALMFKVYSNYSIWAKVSHEGRLTSLSKGTPTVVFAVYEPGHPYLTNPGPTLATAQGQNVEIHIRPDKVSRDFAGILLIHELSHALDLLNKTQVDSSEANETKAYMHEKRAMNIAYDGKLDKALDAVLDKIKPRDVTDFIHLLEKPETGAAFQDSLIDMEKVIGITGPDSRPEAEMRLGFYTVALELRRQERENAGKTSYSISAAKIGKLLKASSKY